MRRTVANQRCVLIRSIKLANKASCQQNGALPTSSLTQQSNTETPHHPRPQQHPPAATLAPPRTSPSPTRDQHVFPTVIYTLNFSAAWLHLSRIIAASLSRQTSKHRAAMNQLDQHS